MKLRLPISLSLLLLAAPVAYAQSADEIFHSGAQSYLSNNLAFAREEVDKGLKAFPDDVKLKKLDELLKQQQQQQQQQDNDDQQKQDEKKDQQSQDQQKQSKDEQQKKDDQKSQEQKKKEEQQKQQSQSSGDKSKDKPENEQPMTAHAMTPQEAKQLLDAQKGNERVLQFRPQIEQKNPEKKLKDW